MFKKVQPVHLGEILHEEFLLPMNISQSRLALSLHVPVHRINEIVNGRRRVTADTALRLVQFFGTSAQFWLGLQLDYDLDVAQDEVGAQIERDVLAYKAA